MGILTRSVVGDVVYEYPREAVEAGCLTIFEEQLSAITARVVGTYINQYYYGGQAYYDPGANIDVCKLAFPLSLQIGDVSGKTYYAEIWTTTGTGSTISLVAKQGETSVGVTGDNSWNKTWVDFIFNSPISLTNGVRYALVIYTPDVDASNYINWWYSSANTMEGFAAAFTSLGARYYYNSTLYDCAVKIYV